jgi:isoleucyl-tRNA synthetase
MSKHLGNILLPMPLMDEHGADALRWFMACSGSPLAARRMGHTALSEIVRKVLLTYWNTVAFHVLYARSEGWSPLDPSTPAPPVAEREVLDRWLISELNTLVGDVTVALERFDTQDAGSRIARFIDDLSNWYVRRSRRRFWRGDVAAFATLHETIDVLTRLMAPLTPFIAERVWQDVVAPVTPDAPESVHLASWPQADTELIVDGLGEQVDLARRVTELGRAARAEAKVRTRQPLRRALVASSAWSRLGDDLRAQVCDELNIGSLESLADAGGDLVDHSAKGNFRSLGKRFAQDTPKVAAAIAAADARKLAESLASSGTAVVDVDGRSVDVGPDDVIVAERPREGWSVVNDQGETVALDLELDDGLRRAGLAREIVRAVQEARKASGLEITDRISLRWTGGADVAEALREHADEIADEVLAVGITEDESATGPSPDQFWDDDLGLRFALAKA